MCLAFVRVRCPGYGYRVSSRSDDILANFMSILSRNSENLIYNIHFIGLHINLTACLIYNIFIHILYIYILDLIFFFVIFILFFIPTFGKLCLIRSDFFVVHKMWLLQWEAALLSCYMKSSFVTSYCSIERIAWELYWFSTINTKEWGCLICNLRL